uniref:Uncharacterized protein n=1 Tax=Anguilla anguilla TaxID=7936 RepID=A0A0E9Q5T7_ANGAN
MAWGRVQKYSKLTEIIEYQCYNALITTLYLPDRRNAELSLW